MTTISFSEFRFLRGAGYFVAFASIISQLVELVLRAWPVQLHTPTWRLSFVSGTSGMVFGLLLMVFLVLAIAALSEDRGVALTVCGLSFSVAIVYLILTGMLVLDALQVRNQVQMSVARQFDMSTAWAAVRQLVGAAGFLFLGIGGWRTTRGAQANRARQTRPADNLVVRTPARAPAIVGVDETPVPSKNS